MKSGITINYSLLWCSNLVSRFRLLGFIQEHSSLSYKTTFARSSMLWADLYPCPTFFDQDNPPHFSLLSRKDTSIRLTMLRQESMLNPSVFRSLSGRGRKETHCYYTWMGCSEIPTEQAWSLNKKHLRLAMTLFRMVRSSKTLISMSWRKGEKADH